jgi:hypothetical protein
MMMEIVKKHEILLGLTTTPNSDWRSKVEEMKKFGIKRIALFPTFLKNAHQRKELYDLLGNIKGLVIPHVHLREQDMEKWEMEWFEEHGAEAYNIHAFRRSHNKALVTYRKKIYLENHPLVSISHDRFRKAAGVCIDFQHWQFAKKLRPAVAEKTRENANKYTVGCCHISPFPKFKNTLSRFVKGVGGHYMISLDELDYVEHYAAYLPQYISLEMENSFEQQLEAKKYLEKILNI